MPNDEWYEIELEVRVIASMLESTEDPQDASLSKFEQESDRNFTVRAEEVNAEIDDFIEEENREWRMD